MKNILICQHGGSGNHGCEALVRTTIKLLQQAEADCRIEIYSYRRGDDEKYLRDIRGLRISGLKSLPGKYSPHNLRYHWQRRVLHDENASKLPLTAPFRRAVEEADVVVAIGGDNYCYDCGRGYWAQDRYIKQQGKPYVLLGASLEPADLPLGLAKHLRLFDLITAREPLSYQALRVSGLTNVALCPDPAFVLETEKTSLPAGFDPAGTVGLNISPLIVKSEHTPGIVMDNYRALIQYILASTTMRVALIPHVVWPASDDRAILRQLKQEFAGEERIFLVEDRGARELKYIISQLRFFVGARTHATIAAYSSRMPTLALGYSVKARGIAQDLFGEEEPYVLDVRQLSAPDQLMHAFMRLMEQEQDIKNTLTDIMPAYQDLANGASLYLERVINGKELLVFGTAAQLAGEARCTGCGLCAAACPSSAILMERSAAGFLYPRIDAELCTRCGRCGSICPALQKQQTMPQPQAYAAFLKDEKTRLASASGGIFTPLAQDLLSHGGYVCGAVYDENLDVRHVLIDDPADLPLLRGSKYQQSELGEVYEPIHQILAAERPLLFVGTPCQTAAIRAWCGDHDYLLTVAIACHGVPSPLLFRKYLGELEQKRGLRVARVDFKHKGQGWRHAQTRIYFGGGATYDDPNGSSTFMKAFLGNLCLRSSCHDCFAKEGVYADLLIGDYWGIDKALPGFADDKGVSVVLTMSDKGRAALSGVSDQLQLRETPFAEAWRYNPALVRSSPYNPRREDFLARLPDEPLAELVNSLLPQPTARDKIRKLLKG